MFSITTETAFWITINAILLALFVALLIRYFKRIRRERIIREYPVRYEWTRIFEETIMKGNAAEAISKTFKIVVEELAAYKGLNTSKSLTAREIVVKVSPTLSERARLKLVLLYKIYEPVRFGGCQPADEKVKEFRENLKELESMLRIRGGGVA